MTAPTYILGNSNEWGSGDTIGAYRRGFLERALGPAAIPYLNLAKPSQTAAQVATDPAIRHSAWRYIGTTGKAMLGWITNDLLAGAAASVPEGHLMLIAGMLRRRGLSEVFLCSPPPKCSSTDGFVTVINQTPQTPPTTQLISAKDWLYAGCPLDSTALTPVAVGTSGALLCDAYAADGTQLASANTSLHLVEAVFDPGGAAEASGDRTRWKASHSGDGLHYNATGHAAAATAIDTDRVAA